MSFMPIGSDGDGEDLSAWEMAGAL
jgi:hypothetical protein